MSEIHMRIKTIEEDELNDAPHGVYRVGKLTVRVQHGELPCGVPLAYRRGDGMAVFGFELEPGYDFYKLAPCGFAKCDCKGAGHHHITKCE